MIGSDYEKVRPDLKKVRDPYSGNDYIVVPPVRPDVAVIHGLKGSPFGAVTVLGLRSDRLLAMAAIKTVAVVEEIVDPDDVLPGRDEIYIAPIHVDAVVPAARGAHPTACPGRYDADVAHLMAYTVASSGEASFRKYLDTYIFGPADHEAYLRLVDMEKPS
jgi:glutaconate CoA-transferase subunit A